MDICKYIPIVIKACIYWILIESRFVALVDAFQVYQAAENNFHERERSAERPSVRPQKYPKKQLHGLRMTNFNEGFAKAVNISIDYSDNIEMRCNLLISPDHIIWEKTQLIYPLAIGRHLFSPDTRLQLRPLSPSRGALLVIANATAADEGEYRCRSASSTRKAPPCNNCNDKHSTSKAKPTEIVFRVSIGLKIAKDIQVDEPQKEKVTQRSTVRIYGPKLAFYGLPLELKCIANFTSPEAKMDPSNVLEWYHNGVRIRNGRHDMGRAIITRRWIDSYLLESRLLLTWVSEREGGMWFCVNRGRQTRPSVELKEFNISQTTDISTTALPVNFSTRKVFSATRLQTGAAETPHDELFIRIMDVPITPVSENAPPSMIGIETHSRYTDIASTNGSLLDPLPCKKNPQCQWLHAAASHRRRPAVSARRPLAPPVLLLVSVSLLILLFT